MRYSLIRCFSGTSLCLAVTLLMGFSSAFPARAQNSFGTVAVASASTAQSVTVTAQAAGTVSTVQVLTLGQSGLDFAPATGGNCSGANLLVNQTCTEQLTFTPATPGLRVGAVLLLNSSGSQIGVAYLYGYGSGPLGVFIPGTMQTIAGDGAWTALFDGSVATQADLDLPSGQVLDGSGNLYIADSAHNRIREVNATTQVISTIAGNGNPAYTGDGSLAVNATLNTPYGVALDGAGNLYIADSGNNAIRKIVLATGVITTVAGNGTAGSSGDNGQATAASLSGPRGVTVDTAGNLYIADTANHKIRKVTTAGVISTIVGDGFTQGNGSGGYLGDNGPATSAELNFPYAVAFDASGNLYIPDSANNRIREVNATSQVITTFAGTGNQGFSGDGGLATAAELYSPSGVLFDPAGNLYIADTQNDRIRKVSAGTGNITSIAGNGIGVYYGDNAGATTAGLYGPYGLALDNNGNLLIADYFDQRIRRVQVNLAIFKLTTAVRQGSTSPTQPQTLENDGNSPLALSAITPDSNSALDNSVTTCAVNTPQLAVNTDCILGAQFAPSVAGNPLTATITTTANAVDSPLLIQITGNATAVNSTTTALAVGPNPADFGQSVGFQATVTTGSGTGALSGTVSFSDGTHVLVSGVTLTANGVASYSNSALAVGAHPISAAYSGDSGHFASTSAAVSEVVNEATQTTLATSANPSGVGASVTFTAVVTAPNGGGVVPDGTVNFLDGGVQIGSATLNPSGVATFSTTALANGQHSITAVYSGDAANYILASTSAVLNQSVQAPSTTLATSSLNPSSYGVTVTFTATVTPGGSVRPTGTVNFLDSGVQIGSATLIGTTGIASFTTSTLRAGQHSITAQYLGGPSNGGSTSPVLVQTVNTAQTATALAAAPNPGIAGRAVLLTASVKVTLGTTVPTGNVTFTDGATALGSAALSAAGVATVSATLAPGQHSITASYAGDANDSASASAALPLNVLLATTSVAVTASPNPALVLAPVTIAATVSGNGGTPTGSVSLLADGANVATAALNAAGAASFTYAGLGVGTHTLSVSYAGDTNDSPSASASASEVIQPIPTATALGVSNSGTTAQQAVLVASVVGVSGPTPTGSVQFLNGAATVGSSAVDSTGVATLAPNLPAGSYSFTAVYSGDAIHSPSTSAAASLTTSPSTFNLTANPTTLNLVTGQNQTLTVSIASVNNGADTITLGCNNLPAAVNCHFSNPSVNLIAGATVTSQLTIDTNNPLGGGASVSRNQPNAPGSSRSANTALAGLFLPFAACFGWLLWRARRRSFRLLSLSLLALLSLGAMALSGCGGFSQTTATPGSYVIQVTGVGTQSNQTHYVNLTLNITK